MPQYQYVWVSIDLHLWFNVWVPTAALSMEIFVLKLSENGKAMFIAETNTAWKESVFGVILVRIFLHSDWIQRDIPYLLVFSPNMLKSGPE